MAIRILSTLTRKKMFSGMGNSWQSSVFLESKVLNFLSIENFNNKAKATAKHFRFLILNVDKSASKFTITELQSLTEAASLGK